MPQLFEYLSLISERMKLLAVELSVVASLCCCGCPNPLRIFCRDIAVMQFSKMPPHSVSATDETIFLMFEHSLDTDTLYPF